MSDLYSLAHRISKLAPGQSICVSRQVLNDAAPPARLAGWDGPEWSSAERIMENIVGSAYEFRFWEDPQSGHVIFERLKKPLTGGKRTYTSPDRR